MFDSGTGIQRRHLRLDEFDLIDGTKQLSKPSLQSVVPQFHLLEKQQPTI